MNRLLVASNLFLLGCLLMFVGMPEGVGQGAKVETKSETTVVDLPSYGLRHSPGSVASAADAREATKLLREIRDNTAHLKATMTALAAKSGADVETPAELDPASVLRRHCAGCHGEKPKDNDFVMFKGGVLQHLPLKERNEIKRRLDDDTMPPDTRPRLSPSEKAAVNKGL